MKKLLLGIGGLVGFVAAGPAMAADLSPAPAYKAAAYVAPGANWTGCYLGGNVGGIIADDRYALRMGGDFLNSNNLFSNQANSSLLNHSYTANNSDSVTGGVQAGCNWQTGVFVWGVEADINGSGLREAIITSYGPAGPFVGSASLAASHTETVTKDLDWFSTFRARLGVTPSPTWMIYVTGGLAVAEIKSRTNLTFGADQFFLNSFVFSGSQTQTRTGWTAGGGAEWALAPNWSFKAEYLYLNFGNFSYTAPCLGPVVAGSCPVGSNVPWNTNVRAQEHVARVGVNYRFNWGGPVRASY